MDILHDPQQQKFYIPLGSEEAHLDYVERDGVMDIQHVYVPASQRGRGLAGKICIKAFDYARENGYRVVPTCPFVANDFLPRFKQYQELVAT